MLAKLWTLFFRFLWRSGPTLPSTWGKAGYVHSSKCLSLPFWFPISFSYYHRSYVWPSRCLLLLSPSSDKFTQSYWHFRGIHHRGSFSTGWCRTAPSFPRRLPASTSISNSLDTRISQTSSCSPLAFEFQCRWLYRFSPPPFSSRLGPERGSFY